MKRNIVVIGQGAIGSAMVTQLQRTEPDAQLHHVARTFTHDAQSNNVRQHRVDYQNESSLEQVAKVIQSDGLIDLCLVCTGMLHNDTVVPEKSLGATSAAQYHALFEANLITPALMAKHFVPLLNSERPSTFAALSARVGSITDNRLGGWYAYRVSKAALNMLIKTTSIELKRRNPHAIIVGLHPGTVDSPLSAPFQRRVPAGKLFTPLYAAKCLLSVIEKRTLADSGKCFAWDGKEIMP